MMNRAPVTSKERLTVLGGVIALHVTLIFLFLLQQTAVAPVEPKSNAIAMFAVEAERSVAATPPPPTLPSLQADTFKPITDLSIPDSEAEAAASGSSACSTVATILEALLLDTIATEAIRRAPPETRSIAGAVVIWNEGWSPLAMAPDTPLAVVRANIEQSLAKIEDSCLDEPVAGPRLLPIPDGGDATIFLVIGSGNWTWRTLLLPPANAAPVPVNAAPTAPRGRVTRSGSASNRITGLRR